MEKVTLFYLKRPDIKIHIQTYFNEQGQLYLDGYDIGKSVENAGGILIMSIPIQLNRKR